MSFIGHNNRSYILSLVLMFPDKTIDMNDVEVFLFKIRRHLCTGSMMYAESLESTQKKLELKLLSSAPPANLLLLEYSPNFLLVS